MSRTTTLTPSGPFSLAEAKAFGFGPRAAQDDDSEPLRLAFATDGDGAPGGAAITQGEDGRVEVALAGDGDEDAMLGQVQRILSLEHDGDAFAVVGEADPVLGALQARYPGLRPVLFHSPYEAACWAIISARRPRAHAQRLRDGIADTLGAAIEVAGRPMTCFPAPEALLEVGEDSGLTAEQVRRLHGVAEAAAEGWLQAGPLRAMGSDAARERVLSLRGLGPFYADLVIVRACGFTDVLAVDEPLVRRAVAHYYGLPEAPGPDELTALAAPWAPFRTWATVLLRVAATRDGVVPVR